MPTIDFFDYVEKNLPNALNNFYGENAFVGVAVGSVIEFLGRCASSQNGLPNNSKDFKYFIRNYLSKIDQAYNLHDGMIYDDLRHGSAHTTMTNGGVRLSVDPKDSKFHLNLFEEQQKVHLLIYTPKLLDDLKKAITLFAQDAKTNPRIQNSCKNTLEAIELHGQKLIKKNYRLKKI